MEAKQLLADAYTRIRQNVERALNGLTPEQAAWRPHEEANSIAWLVWHLTRVQDDHVSEIAGLDQAWTSEGWHKKIGMPENPVDTGYGHTADQVAAFRPVSLDDLLGYHRAVNDRSLAYFESKATAEELDRIIDRSYDPPVSVGVRLVSVINDNTQHSGQALYVRGLIEKHHFLGA